MLSSSRDRSLRLWQKTDEPLVLEEEREEERAREEERRLATGPAAAVPGETDLEAGRAGHKTAETERAVRLTATSPVPGPHCLTDSNWPCTLLVGFTLLSSLG